MLMQDHQSPRLLALLQPAIAICMAHLARDLVSGQLRWLEGWQAPGRDWGGVPSCLDFQTSGGPRDNWCPGWPNWGWPGGESWPWLTSSQGNFFYNPQASRCCLPILPFPFLISTHPFPSKDQVHLRNHQSKWRPNNPRSWACR